MNKYLDRKNTIAEQMIYENTQIFKLKKVRLKRPEKTRIIAVTNQKGGVGKTTSTVNIAAALAKKNQKVLVIDIDQQSNASTALNIIDKNVPTIYDVLTNDSVNGKDVIQSVSENLSIIPSSIGLSNLELKLNDERLLTKKLKKLSKSGEYDYIFVDCPPSMGIFTLNALIFANEIIIPIQCEYYALEGLAQIMANIADIKKIHKTNLSVVGIIMTMFSMRNNLSKEVVDEVRKHFPLLIFDSIIPRSVKIAEAPSFGQTIIEYEPKSVGTIAYTKAAVELSKKTI